MHIDTSSVFTIIGSAVCITLFGFIKSYFASINKELMDMKVQNARLTEMLASHSKEFRDIWNKFQAIDRHIENTDKSVQELHNKVK